MSNEETNTGGSKTRKKTTSAPVSDVGGALLLTLADGGAGERAAELATDARSEAEAARPLAPSEPSAANVAPKLVEKAPRKKRAKKPAKLELAPDPADRLRERLAWVAAGEARCWLADETAKALRNAAAEDFVREVTNGR